MTALCPHCKRDISDGALIERGRWALLPGMIYHDGECQPLRGGPSLALYAIARGNGEYVTHHDMPGVGEGELAYRYRMIRKALGERCPVTFVRGRGYRWAAGA
ncbi:hypothetical protein [Novosphingobium resinovorum]|uniref:OmpR/PhoB-type domain-containing protein n=1 Tax=Novosphingobium resinovorum TaxID=158500 RepID=A0A1D8A524_9SPHN|nr:hypothetical protein [Novosphingobium resinovorum]AOR77202.1 hypothetical protein BES08_10910 [Novosphingobium resinovorum]